jgi:hypothetical protein
MGADLIAAHWTGRPVVRGARRLGSGRAGREVAGPPPSPPNEVDGSGGGGRRDGRAGEPARPAWLTALPCTACASDIAAALAL